MAVGAREHVVVLVPGFLGFDCARRGASGRAMRGDGRGDHARIATSLRAALEAHCGLPIPVVALPVSHGTTLAVRQRSLLRQLEALDGALRGVRQFHLVGHGPGGVDAELLTACLPLKAGATWHDLDPTHVRERIASIMTLGAPHYGTQLADQPCLTAWQRPQRLDLLSLRQAATLSAALVLEALTRARQREREYGAALSLLLGLLGKSQLLQELAPHAMQALRVHNPPDPGLVARVQSIVVVAPELTLEDAGVLRLRDRVFSVLYGLTAQRSLSEPPLALSHAQKLLRQVPPERVIRHPSARVPAFDFAANDGLVNAVRQLPMTRVHQDQAPAAVVIADHADVLGYYDERSAWSLELRRPGLLRSGANFGDDEFFHVWGLVAAHIASNALEGRTEDMVRVAEDDAEEAAAQ